VEDLLLRQLSVIQGVVHVNNKQMRYLVCNHLTHGKALDDSLSVFGIENVEEPTCDLESLATGQKSGDTLLKQVSKLVKFLLVRLTLEVVDEDSLHDGMAGQSFFNHFCHCGFKLREDVLTQLRLALNEVFERCSFAVFVNLDGCLH